MIKRNFTYLLLLCASIIFASISFAQTGPKMKLKEDYHNFGVVMERDGNVNHFFKFKNVGDAPLQIQNVQASCGCTTPKWSKKPIKPGGEGYIEVSFDPLNRPGFFQKNITVLANTSERRHMLTIEGDVKEQPPEIEKKYPHQSGNLLMKRYNVFFGAISDRSKVDEELIVFNPTEEVINIESIEGPSFVEVQGVPAEIPPKMEVSIRFRYDAEKRKKEVVEYGFVHDELYLITDDEKEKKKKLFMVADLSPYVNKNMGKEKLEKAPKMEINKQGHIFGEAKEGDVLKASFEIKNTGKEPLALLDVNTSCGCTVSEPERNYLKTGESTKLNVNFDTEGRTGKQEKTITLYTNDPLKPKIKFTIQAVVK